MSKEQINKFVRWAVTGVSGFLIGWASSRGYQWGDILGNLLSSEFIVGIIGTGVTALLAWLTGKAPWLVGVVNAIPEVKGVITQPTVAGKALALEVPSPSVVTAGTNAAIEVAKT